MVTLNTENVLFERVNALLLYSSRTERHERRLTERTRVSRLLLHVGTIVLYPSVVHGTRVICTGALENKRMEKEQKNNKIERKIDPLRRFLVYFKLALIENIC